MANPAFDRSDYPETVLTKIRAICFSGKGTGKSIEPADEPTTEIEVVHSSASFIPDVVPGRVWCVEWTNGGSTDNHNAAIW